MLMEFITNKNFIWTFHHLIYLIPIYVASVTESRPSPTLMCLIIIIKWGAISHGNLYVMFTFQCFPPGLVAGFPTWPGNRGGSDPITSPIKVQKKLQAQKKKNYQPYKNFRGGNRAYRVKKKFLRHTLNLQEIIDYQPIYQPCESSTSPVKALPALWKFYQPLGLVEMP